VVQVAVGIVYRRDGAVLMADRPAGKPYAGYWEFPGGKVEPDEAVEAALARELTEELAIRVAESVPWVVFEHDYPHAYVRLHFRRIFDWSGTPQALEGQRLAFQRLDRQAPVPLLPAAVPVVRWLKLPDLLHWATAFDAGRSRLALRALRFGGETWRGCEVRDRAGLAEAAALGADFAVVTAPPPLDLAGLCREAPIPIYLPGALSAAGHQQALRLGAHGLYEG
jgi:8-oxo-dGTP diphosphatase